MEPFPSAKVTFRPETARRYTSGRLDYAPGTATAILARTQLTPPLEIADIGSGTGMLGRHFRDVANRIHAIEPNPAMRAQGEIETADLDAFQFKEACGEATTLMSHSIDLILCGRSLHWMALDRARLEFQRILRPGGWLVIAENIIDDPLQQEVLTLRDRLFPDSEQGYLDAIPAGFIGRPRDWVRNPRETGALTLYGIPPHALRIPSCRRYRMETFMDYLLSFSGSTSQRQELSVPQQETVLKWFGSRAGSDGLTVQYTTLLWVGRMGPLQDPGIPEEGPAPQSSSSESCF